MGSNKYSLTTPQKNIYVFEKMNQNTPAGNIVGIFKIHDFFDFEKCNIALNKVLKNNDALRIEFFEEESIFQRVKDYSYVEFERLDFTNSKDELDEYLNNISTVPFKIINNNLYDFKIIKTGESKGICVIKLHHLISDAYTFMQIENQLIEIYDFLINNNSTVDLKSFSYIDFINSEKEYFSSDKYLDKDKRFFNEYLEKYSNEILFKENLNFSLKADRYSVTLNDESYEINKYCKKNKVSPFALFIAVYSIYIYRTRNLNDIVLGSPILNRSNFKEKNTMGMFVSTIPIRIKLDEDIKVIDFIREIGNNTKSVFRHQKYPLSDILKNLNRKNKLFNHMISYQNARADVSKNYSSDWIFSKYIQNEFEMHIMDMDNTGKLTINYDFLIDKFNLEEIKFLHRRFLTIINNIVEDLNVTIDNINIIDDKEKELILTKVNPVKINFDTNNVIKLFEENVRKNSDKVAYIFENKKLTYGELNKKANSLARYLKIKYFIRSNDLVPIIANRGFDMIISILGILKAGGAYVPIDPSFPKDRINYMINDTNPKVVVNNTNVEIDNNFEEINLNNIPLNIFTYDNLNNIINDRDLAYVIYTSGTTGKPKGCMIEHRNLFNLVNSVYNYQKLEDIENFVSLSTYSFDIFLLENFIPLSFNKTVFLSNEEEQKMPVNMLKLIKDNDIEIISITPTRIKLLLNYIKDEKLTKVKRIMLGGEVFPRGVFKLLKKIMPNSIIYDGYGPTEITVWSSAKEIINEENINIGKSLPNYNSYILDSKNRILPLGIKGELCVGGNGVARGYNNREDLNSKKFIQLDNDRIYKTGDIAYIDFNYDLNYVSRIDNQIKLHGLRIELSEIENTIKGIEGILECYVIIKDDDKIIAYYSGNTDIDIKKYLKSKLPKYMIPNYFIKVDKFEINHLGKVDKSKLKDLVIENKKINNLPQNDIQKFIYDELCKLLKIDNIDINEDLFEYGVDSIILIRLVSNINLKYDIQLTEKQVLENTNIYDLEKVVSELINKKNNESINIEKNENINIEISKEIVEDNILEEKNIVNKIEEKNENIDIEISKEIVEDNILEEKNIVNKIEEENKNIDINLEENSNEKIIKFNLTNSEKGILKSYFFDTESIMYNIPFEISLKKEGIEIDRLKNAIINTILNNKILFSKVDYNDSKFYGFINEKDINFDLDILYASLDEYNYFKNKFIKAFDLLNDRLFDIKFFVVDDKIYILFDFNHIIFDGFSFQLLLDEIKNRYENNEVLSKDKMYDELIDARANLINNKEAREFYLDKFSGDISDTLVDLDNERSENKLADKISITLDDDLSKKVREFSNNNKITFSNVFLGMFSLLLSKYTYNEDIIIGMAFNSRSNYNELNSLGMFVKTIPLRFNIDFNSNIKDYFYNIQNNVIDYMKNSDYEYESLIKELNISREKFKNPLFNIVYSYNNNKLSNNYINNNYININEIGNLDAKFDIVFEVVQNNKFILNFEFNKSIYLKESIELLVKYYINMLNYLDKYYVKDILLIDDDEKKYILNEYNNTKESYPEDISVNEYFEKVVVKYNNKSAIVFEDEKITYDELNKKTNKLARYLRTLNLTRNAVIAIDIDKSIEFVVAMLAIIKSGYAYLPINKDIPIERAKYMLENANVKYILTTEKYKRELNGVNILIDKDFEYDDSNLELLIFPEDLLYVLYTSGTTGLPKGIEIKHKGILRLIVDKNYLDYTDKDIMLLSGSVTFDTTSYEVFNALLRGMTLHIVSKNNVLNPIYFKEYMEKNKITVCLMPTPIFNVLSSIDNTIFKNMRVLCVGGDVLLPKYAKLITDNFENVSLVNCYGPTESTILCTCYNVKKGDIDIPVGKPIVNTKVYIIDKCNNLCPRNIKGEIIVGGTGLAKGYINRSELTEEKFNYIDGLRGKVYRTGDLGIFNYDYNINYLGRIDFQVKIRGQRIEILEVQNKLLEINNIKEGFVSIFDKNLVAFYSSEDDAITEEYITNYLKKYLPRYMIPLVIKVEKLPFNQNLKIDNKVLKEIYLDYSRNLNNEYCSDKDLNSTEIIILNAFKEVLNNDNINMNSDFFLNGGDSLMLVQVISILNVNDIKINIEEAFNLKTPREVYEFYMNKK